MWKEEDAEIQSVEGADPGFETVPTQALVIPPTAKRGIMILAAFFLLQIVFAVIAGIALSVIFAVSGGNVSDSETLAANLEDNALLVNMTGTYVASIILVFWLWLKAIDPEDGISFEFLGLRQFTLVSLAKPAATGSGLGFAFLLLGGLLCEAPEGPEFGPLTTLFTASGWGLVLWAVTALLFAPIVEELLFRSVLLKSFLQNWPSPPASLVATITTIVVFTAFHYQEFVYFPFAALAIFTMAATATYFRLKSDNLFAAVALHFFYNFSLVLSMLLARTSV